MTPLELWCHKLDYNLSLFIFCKTKVLKSFVAVYFLPEKTFPVEK